jgi:hypothetical protein
MALIFRLLWLFRITISMVFYNYYHLYYSITFLFFSRCIDVHLYIHIYYLFIYLFISLEFTLRHIISYIHTYIYPRTFIYFLSFFQSTVRLWPVRLICIYLNMFLHYFIYLFLPLFIFVIFIYLFILFLFTTIIHIYTYTHIHACFYLLFTIYYFPFSEYCAPLTCFDW